jgi:hypothetical protein
MQELKQFLEKQYPIEVVLNMYLSEIENWIYPDWNLDYDSIFECYGDINNGEAEDVVVFTIKKQVEKQLHKINKKIDLYTFIKKYYEFLN